MEAFDVVSESPGGLCLEAGGKRWWFPMGFRAGQPDFAQAVMTMANMAVPEFRLTVVPPERVMGWQMAAQPTGATQ